MANLIRTPNHTFRAKDVEWIEKHHNIRKPEPYIILIYRYNHPEPVEHCFINKDDRDATFEEFSNILLITDNNE